MKQQDMDKKDSYMDDLFKAAREESPKLPLDSIKASFIASLGPGGGATGGGTSGMAGSGGSTTGLLTIKTMIMTTLILTTAALIINSGSDAQTNYETRSRVAMEISDYSDLFTESDMEPLESKDVEPFQEKTNRSAIVSNSDKDIKPVDTVPKVKVLPVIQNKLQTPLMVYTNDSSQQKEREVVFYISNETTKAELEDIQQQAIDAGIDFQFSTRGMLRKLKLEMHLDSEEGDQDSSISVNGTFDFSIGWIVDEEGKAIRFWNDLTDGEGDFLCSEHHVDHCEGTHVHCDSSLTFEEGTWVIGEEGEEGEEDEEHELLHDHMEMDYGSSSTFVITQDTEKVELEEMKDKALEAGVLFEYDEEGNNKYFQIMFVSEGSRQTKRIEVTEDEFTVELGWQENEEGRAYKFKE